MIFEKFVKDKISRFKYFNRKLRLLHNGDVSMRKKYLHVFAFYKVEGQDYSDVWEWEIKNSHVGYRINEWNQRIFGENTKRSGSWRMSDVIQRNVLNKRGLTFSGWVAFYVDSR